MIVFTLFDAAVKIFPKHSLKRKNFRKRSEKIAYDHHIRVACCVAMCDFMKYACLPSSPILSRLIPCQRATQQTITSSFQACFLERCRHGSNYMICNT